METTEPGIAIEVTLLLKKNACLAMAHMEFGIIVFLHPKRNVLEAVSIIALQFSRESKTTLSSSTTICSNPEQWPNGFVPIELTALPIVIEFKLKQ